MGQWVTRWVKGLLDGSKGYSMGQRVMGHGSDGLLDGSMGHECDGSDG